MRKFLVMYTYQKEGYAGIGSSFAKTYGRVTQDKIEKWEEKIKKDKNFDNIAIASFQELEED